MRSKVWARGTLGLAKVSSVLEGMARHSARRCWRKKCQKDWKERKQWRDAAQDANCRRQKEGGGGVQHQPTCRSSERARLWGDTKVAAEKFKEASEKLAANEREKVLADEAARAAVSNRTAKTLAKKRRKRQKQREETKKRTVADDGEASVMGCPRPQAQEDNLHAKKEGELPLLVKVVGRMGYEQVPWSETRTASEVVKLMRERSDTEEWNIHMQGQEYQVWCGPMDGHVASRKGTLREDGVMAGSTVYVRLRFLGGTGAATTLPHHPRNPNPTDPCPSPIPSNQIFESMPLTITPATITPWSITPRHSPIQ